MIKAALLMATLATPALAGDDIECYHLAQFERRWAQEFNEAPLMTGMMSDGSGIVMIWANDVMQSWTLVMVNSKEVACVVAQGEALGIYQLPPPT